MANELAVVNGAALAHQQSNDDLMPTIMESVIMAGDIAKLTSQQRVEFYGHVCKSMGLNPLTKPFDYLNLNGKLTLYAGKNCAEQLRLKHRISLKIVSREVIDGVYVVTARATTPDGREDESTGAVPAANNAADRANVIMKAETKAKRRVTLSICGLGMMDDSEVDSVRGARRASVDVETGELVKEAEQIDTGGHAIGTQAAADHVAQQKIASGKQRGTPGKSPDYYAMLEAFHEIKKQLGDEAYYRILGTHGYAKSNEIPDADKGREIYRDMAAALKAKRDLADQVAPAPKAEPQPVATMADLPTEMWPEGRD